MCLERFKKKKEKKHFKKNCVCVSSWRAARLVGGQQRSRMYLFSSHTPFCTSPWRMFPLNVCDVDETKPYNTCLNKEHSLWATSCLSLLYILRSSGEKKITFYWPVLTFWSAREMFRFFALRAHRADFLLLLPLKHVIQNWKFYSLSAHFHVDKMFLWSLELCWNPNRTLW